MRVKNPQPWDVTTRQAVRIQENLRCFVSLDDDFGTIRVVAGVDVGFSSAEGLVTGGVVALTFPELKLIETASATEPVRFPYVPGLLSFREMPVILAAFEILSIEPDLMIMDGQGLAHPRRFGIACHLGVALDCPCIGCGKSRLIGKYEEPGPMIGDSSPLMIESERIGSVLRTKDNVKPLFISPGHRISFESAEKLILELTRGYKLPEPIRLAHNLVSHTT